MRLTVSDPSQPAVSPGLDMPRPRLAPRVHRAHVNPLLKNAEGVSRGIQGKGGRAERLPLATKSLSRSVVSRLYVCKIPTARSQITSAYMRPPERHQNNPH